MKMIYILPILVLFLSCESKEVETESQEVVYNTPPDLSGRWRYIRNEIIIPNDINDEPKMMLQEWTYMYIPYRADIIIEGDSLFRVDYPLELDYRFKYDIGSCYIKTGGNIGISRYVLKDDTLILYREDEQNFVKEHFKKMDYSDSTMTILKEDTVNYALLADEWHLMRMYNYGDDGSEYWLNYQHTVPDDLVMTREDFLSTMHNGRQVKFLTDGVNRPYTYNYVSYWLTLTPGDWYVGDDVVLEFERKTW